MVAVYMGLRWIAFGNVVGGDGGPTSYGSPRAFLHYHSRFWQSLLGPHLLDVHGSAALRWVAVGAVLGVPAVASLRPSEGRPLWLRHLLFFGPGWYLVTTALFYGTYYDDRHHSLPLVGLVLAWTLAAEGAISRLTDRWRASCVGAALLAATVLLLPATLRNGRAFHDASRVTERARAEIETLTRGLPDGSAVLLVGTPLQEDPPFYFGWGLQSALRRPFTASDAAGRLRIIDRRSLAMNRSTVVMPERFELKIRFAQAPLGSVESVSRPGSPTAER
jgi:hypothetical protein